jgi:DnaJ-class molecular chaperone
MTGQQPAPCGSCGGTGGRIEDTSSDGVIRQNWITCNGCGGSGEAN